MPQLQISSVEFVSVEFALFFLLFLPVYWAVRTPRAQNALLLAVGLGWLVLLAPGFALTLLGYAFFVAFVARQIAADRRAARSWLVLGIVGGIGHLALYKYGPLLPHDEADGVRWVMPLGLSYYTFQSITYMHEVYAGRIRPWRWGDVPLYLGFFPTISSGPIWRAGQARSVLGVHKGADAQLLVRADAPPRTMQQPALALLLGLLGLAKVWWLSGWVEESLVAQVFSAPSDAPGVLLAIYAAAAQLYLSFSGHADLAIAIGMLLGFRLPPNFAAPFWAYNIRDFWGRWHISLSTWIRDYIYIPLGGSRGKFARTQFNLLAAMVLSGIWHGASWLFLLWGLAHGLALVLLNVGDRLAGGKARLAALGWPGRTLGRATTLTFVAFSFLVFRCATLGDLRDVLLVLVTPEAWSAPTADTLRGAAALALLWLLQPLAAPLLARSARALDVLPRPLWFLPLGAAFWLLLVMAPSGVPGFIYANF